MKSDPNLILGVSFSDKPSKWIHPQMLHSTPFPLVHVAIFHQKSVGI